MKKLKKIFLIVGCLIVVIIIAAVIYYQRPFQSREHLDFQAENIDSVEIHFSNGVSGDEWYETDDREAIEELSDYICSLELVEVKKKIEPYAPDYRYVTIYIDGELYTPEYGDGQYDLVFAEGTVRVCSDWADDNVFTPYKIMNSEYNPITQNDSERSFLKELVQKYQLKPNQKRADLICQLFFDFYESAA